MTDEQIKRIARRVNRCQKAGEEAGQKAVVRRPRSLTKRQKAMICYLVSPALAAVLSDRGINTVHEMGIYHGEDTIHGKHTEYYHEWCRLPDGRILDASADQFGGPQVRILDQFNPLYDLYKSY